MNSSRAPAFDLLAPFLRDGRVDRRLLRALGVAPDDYEGHFETVADADEGTRFDFYMQTGSGRRIFLDVKVSESGFGICADDEAHREKLKRHYRPHLNEHLDAKWLEPAAFFANYEVLRKISYLGRYADSGVVFIFPKGNAGLMAVDETIKQIVSKTLAPRIAIFHLEYLLERILVAVKDDEALRRHFLAFQEGLQFPRHPPRSTGDTT